MTTLPLPSNYCSMRCLANNRHPTNTCELFKGDSHNTIRSAYFFFMHFFSFSVIQLLSQVWFRHPAKILSTDVFLKIEKNRQSNENKCILPPQKSTTFPATCTEYLALSCNDWCGLPSLLKYRYHQYLCLLLPTQTSAFNSRIINVSLSLRTFPVASSRAYCGPSFLTHASFSCTTISLFSSHIKMV